MTVLRSPRRSTSASVQTMCSGSGTGSVADTPCVQLWVWSLSPCRYSALYYTVDRSIPKLMNTTLPYLHMHVRVQYGFPLVEQFLAGAHAMDTHFFETPLRQNLPVLMGLLGVWNSSFLGHSARAILPCKTKI